MRMLLQHAPLGIVAALAACSIDTATFMQGREDCAAAGDEDGNGEADCSDPACAGAASCQPRCGNGKLESSEECDDGNASNDDACTKTCAAARCGDGFVRTGVEECDDGNASNQDACLDTCVAARCGDGLVRTGAEACDDGNGTPGDGCESTCKVTGTGSYEAISDAMIRISTAISDASTNYGTEPGLFTYGSSFGTVARSLLAFDLAALPPGSSIQSAYLKVRMIDQAGIDFSIGVHELLAPWSEASVTWDNQPAFSPTLEASLGFQGYTWWRFDVTALVQRWVNTPGAIAGIVLTQEPEFFASGGQYARFDSREGTERPHLEIIVGP